MTNFKSYEQISNKTKAGRAGNLIKCPNCYRIERRVYNMNWAEATCRFCHTTSNKYEWLIEEYIYR